MLQFPAHAQQCWGGFEYLDLYRVNGRALLGQVTCRRCGQVRAGLERAPLPGALGPVVLENTCASCWAEWVEEQTRLINHERLTPADPKHRAVLYGRLQDFLRLNLNLNLDREPPS